MKINRRELIKGGMSLSALALANPLSAKVPEKTSVVIIGGGLAGLNSALILKDAGVNVILLEGSSRVGGRVHTADGVETRPEYGASQIGRSYARLLSLCERFKLNLVPEQRHLMPMSNYVNQTWVKSTDWENSPLNKTVGKERKIPPALLGSKLLTELNPLKNLTDWLDPKNAPFDISVYDLLKKNGASDEAMKLVNVTTDLHTASALGLLQEKNRGLFELSFSDAQTEVIDRPYGFENKKGKHDKLAMVSNIEGGCSRLPEAMAKELGERVRTDKIVREINMSETGAQVRCLDGSRFDCDYVISAIPFSTLQFVSISPRVEGAKAESIFKLDYADTTRAFGIIEEPFWEEDGLEPSFFTDETIQMFWAIDKRTDEDKPRFMVVFTDPAASRIDQLPKHEAIALIESEINRIRPSTKGKLKFVDMYGWKTDPLAQGCRHMYAPGQVTQFAKEIVEPHYRLHFAGEHTRRTDMGMESALETGERAAVEIISRV